jgi:hypothetical protein
VRRKKAANTSSRIMTWPVISEWLNFKLKAQNPNPDKGFTAETQRHRVFYKFFSASPYLYDEISCPIYKDSIAKLLILRFSFEA